MYNGYNYYSPNGSSTTTSPVFLMPYPYQYDPFFMAPNTEVPVNGEEENVEEQEVKQETEDNESTEKDGEKENNQNVEEPNVSVFIYFVINYYILMMVCVHYIPFNYSNPCSLIMPYDKLLDTCACVKC